MTALSEYNIGTVSVAADGTAVTGTSTLWLSAGNAKPGYFFTIGHFGVFITDIADDTHLTVTKWPGATVSGASYSIWKVAQGIFNTELLEDVDKIVAALNGVGYMVFVRSTLTAPDSSLGEEDQYAFQPSTGAYWLKSGGVWVPSAGPIKGYGGTSTTSLAIGAGAKAFTTQANLAYDGARVRASVGTDPTKWMEGVATFAGTTLTITVDKISGSGTFASWKFSVSGQPGDISNAPCAPGGRLTLSAGTPVMASSVTGATTVRYTPYVGGNVPIYDGASMIATAFTELTQTTTDTTKSPAAVAANANYDLFVWNDAGTVRLSRGPGWTSDTARGTGAGTTELTRVNGLYLNANAITNGPAAQRGTYVGTIRSNGSSQIDYNLGSSAAGGGAAFIGVWNAYNRVAVGARVADSTASWTLSAGTIRAANNSVGNRISYVAGLQEDFQLCQYFCRMTLAASAGAAAAIRIGLDAVNATAGSSTYALFVTPSAGALSGTQAAVFADLPSLGFHYLQALENGDGTTTTTYVGAQAQCLTLQWRA